MAKNKAIPCLYWTIQYNTFKQDGGPPSDQMQFLSMAFFYDVALMGMI